MKTFSPLPKLVFDNSISFDTANHMFDIHTYAANASVFCFFFIRKLSTTRLFLWLKDLDAIRSEPLKSCVLSQRTAHRKLIGFTVNAIRIMAFAFPRRTQTGNVSITITNQYIFYGMLLRLAAIIQLLFIGVRGTIYRSFCSILEKNRVVSGIVASVLGICSVSSGALS